MSPDSKVSPPGDSPGTPDRWFILALVALDYFVLYLHRNLINYFQPPLEADLDIGSFELGLLSWGFVLPYCLAQLVVGYLGDRYPRRTVLLGSLAGSFICLGLMSLVQSFGALLALRVALALAQSPSVPAIASVVADCFKPRTRSKAIGIYLVSYNFSLVVGGWLGGMVADQEFWTVPFSVFGGQDLEVAGWRMSLLIFAGFGALVALVLVALFREPGRTGVEKDPSGLGVQSLWSTVGSVLKIPTFRFIAIVFVLIAMIMSAVQYWLPRYLTDQFGLNLAQAGLKATIWIQSAAAVGLLLGGRWSDSWAQRWMSGRSLVQLIGLAALGPALLVIGSGNSGTVLVAALILFGFGTALYLVNLWACTFEVVSPRERATAIGLLNLSNGVFSSWADPVIGHVADSGVGLGSILSFLSLAAVLAVMLLIWSVKYVLPRDYRGQRLKV